MWMPSLLFETYVHMFFRGWIFFGSVSLTALFQGNPALVLLPLPLPEYSPISTSHSHLRVICLESLLCLPKTIWDLITKDSLSIHHILHSQPIGQLRSHKKLFNQTWKPLFQRVCALPYLLLWVRLLHHSLLKSALEGHLSIGCETDLNKSTTHKIPSSIILQQPLAPTI